jgi:hypothetical protein
MMHSSLDRRRFLLRTGMSLGAVLLAGRLPQAALGVPALQEDWQTVRAQFSLAPELIHLAAFFLASHPAPVRQAIERHRAGFDADPIGYWLEHEEKQEAIVLRAAADYLGAEPAEIAPDRKS